MVVKVVEAREIASKKPRGRKKAPKPVLENVVEVLDTWNGLNSFVISADEDECQRLLDEELRSRKRLTFALRIHSRLNRVRATRERAEISRKLAE